MPSEAMAPRPRLSVGIDLVEVDRIQASLDSFGERFLHRIFAQGEIDYASSSPDLTAERLAARFAAKEALKKALRLEAVGFRDIEVTRDPSGACDLLLHNGVGRDVESVALSLSHDGAYATAVVVVEVRSPPNVSTPTTDPL